MEPGETVADRFVIEQLAGAGGMGAVYRARDRVDGATVALKVLHPTAHAGGAERFARECALLAELTHPAIVRYVAHGITPEGDHYLAMEWLEGVDLAQRLRQRPLTPGDAVALTRRAAEALAVAHRRGVVHRDLKPSNVFLPGGDVARARLLDFGIARLTGDAGALTRTGVMIGTPGYMAPEQARGDRAIGPAADVFALGCVLYECLTGRPPFAGESLMAVLAKVLVEEPARASELRPGLDPGLDALCARMLKKDPAARPADADALLAELAALGHLAPAAEAPARAGSEALTTREQRVVSVVAAGGPGADATVVGPEALAALEGRRRAVRAAVEASGGRVEFLADGSLIATLASSGSGAATDQAARAARCALAVRALVPDGAVVLATGRSVLAGRMPVGEVIDRSAAALTRGAAGRDFVALDAATAGLLDAARFDVVADRDGAFRLRGERDAVEAGRTLLGRPSACVGRERELATLGALWDECAREPVARAVLCTGAAGAGKSRLAQEFVGRVRAAAPGGATVLHARGDARSAGSPFGVIAGAVRRWAGVDPGDAPEARRERVRAAVERAGSTPAGSEARERLTVFLGELSGAHFPDAASEALRAARTDARVMGDALRAAFEDWLAGECARGPVLLVVDDLHHGDLPSVRFLDGALRLLRDAPLMVLALARAPEVHQLFPSLWAEREAQELRLGGLNRKAAERLVRDALGERCDAATVARLVERAEGNAFYLEELVRAVAEGQGAALPETVLGMVQARLDAVEPEGRRVLRAASVFGERFHRGGLAALLGAELGDAAVDEWLAALCHRELIARRGAVATGADPQYAFGNTLVREAAYATLTDADRALGHRLAAEWLERSGGHAPVALAEHFVAGGAPARAVAWLLRAAEQALEGNDLAGAVALAERGVACGAAGEALGALRLVQAEAHRWQGALGDAVARAQDAALALPRGSARWFHAASEVITSSGRQGHFDAVEQWVRDASFVPPAPGAARMRVVCLCRGVVQLLNAGRYGSADALVDQVDALLGDPSGLDRLAAAWVYNFRAARALHAGDPGEDLRYEEAALAAFDAAGDARTACNARVNLGHAYAELGDYGRAEELLRQALAAAERMGLQTVAALARHNLGDALAQRGELAEAREVEARAAAAGRAHGMVRLEGGARIYLARIARRAGDAPGAEREAREAVALLANAAPMRAVALAELSRALLAAGRADDAREAATEAVMVLSSLGGIEEGEVLVRLAFAEALLAAGDERAARSAAERCREALLARAARLDDPRLRESFLTRVGDNARALELAALLGPPGV